MTALRLEDHGLQSGSTHPPCSGTRSATDSGRCCTATASSPPPASRPSHAGDGEAWLDLCRTWDRIGGPLVDALTSPFPPVRAGARLLPGLRGPVGLDTVRRLATPVASLGRELFGGPAGGLLLAGNAGHADFPLASPGSGVFGVLMTMLGQTVGFPVPRGGAQSLTDALVTRFTSLGGQVECDAPVTRVVVRDGAVARRRHPRRRAYDARVVVADVAAPHLFGGLVGEDDLPPRAGARHAGLRAGPGHRQGRLGADRVRSRGPGPGRRTRAPCTSPTRSRR